MIWANGTNPVNQSPDSHLVARALRSVPFKVMVDAFMTDTAELADLILPCTLNLEQENLNPSYFHDFINYARPAIPPPEGARSDSRQRMPERSRTPVPGSRVRRPWRLLAAMRAGRNR